MESKYQGLFDLMSKEYGLILLESEMQDIIAECQKIPKYEECCNCGKVVEMINIESMCPICKC